MRNRVAAAFLAMVLLGSGGLAHARASRFCRRHCAAAIAACVQVGGRRQACRRATIRQCKHDGAVCSVTTTTFSFPTTTTFPSGVVQLEASNVQTLYEIGLGVPARGSEFVALEVTIRNGGAGNVSPVGIVLHAAGLDYASYGAYYGPYPPSARPGACDIFTSVAPGGELTCGLVFQVHEGVTSGRLTLGQYYTTSAVSSSEFAIPSATRPTASLTIDAVSEVAFAGYCSPRPGFKVVQFAMMLTSHGASGLALDVYRLALLADNARYTSACGYLVPDPCDGAIGVPVDGASSCTAAFEVRESVGAGTLLYDDGRYQASADFALD